MNVKGAKVTGPDEYRDIEFKEVDRVRRRHRRKHYLLRFLIFVLLCAAVFLFLKSGYFALKDLVVEGNSYYTDEEIISMSRAKKGSNIIFDAGIREMEKRLIENPYFADVRVSRRLPSTLLIDVTEREQAAAVIYGDSYIVIDPEGTVLRRTDVDPELTQLTGLTISRMDVGEKIETEESEALSMTLRMLASMHSGDIYFIRIDVSKVIVKCYIYDSLIVKGTPSEIMNSIGNGDLQKTVSDLFARGISRGTIKMGGDSYLSFSPEIDAD